ncbi:putative LytR family regulatory protein [Gordonia araii NBRC 100433]|uniref:Putative LytR family regulatory protein n=1 Tax=Gordonia araii NBRC 100433 TaxID=1073574 RepID=G7GYQ7_9ACTN|nr:LCP family protein [Gordonia araii]NNG98967.1 LytR family transcriptional regulator [Gordonia araii NBRC 100433]GAB08732.1 putative LytR family regulatory protein [Gordonia araii NBRC 100433]
MERTTPTRRGQRRPAPDAQPRRAPNDEQRARRAPEPEQREGRPRRPQRAPAPERRPAPQRVPGRKGRPTRTSSGEIHTGEPQRAKPAKKQQQQAKPVRKPQQAKPTKASRPATPESAPSAAETPPPPKPPMQWRNILGGAGGRRRAHRVGQVIVALVSVASLALGAYSWRSASEVTGSITQLAGLNLGGGQDGAVDLLLVGTDSRTDAKGVPLTRRELRWLRSGDETSTNTDTILLIRIPNNGSSATAISIPRDAYVDVPGIGMSKINAAYGATKEKVRRSAVEAGGNPDKAERDGTQAGRKALIDTVAKLTGVEVDHYAEVGLLGFALLTNAVGGVEVCLKNPVRERYSGAKFRKGRQVLNGPKALSFVRQRHGLPRGDLDRITRQQVFMASLAQKMLSARVLADPKTMDKLQVAISRSVIIDDNWDILAFAEKLRDLSGGKVRFATIPIVTEEGWSEEGQSIVKIDPQAVHEFTDELLTGDEPKKRQGKEAYTIDVVNAGTIDGLAANVSNVLTAKGYRTGKTSTKPLNERDSIIFAHDADDSTVKQLSSALGGVAIRADQSLPERQVRVVLTNTYYGPGSIMDTGPQPDAQRVADAKRQKAERVGSAGAPITASARGPMCVN